MDAAKNDFFSVTSDSHLIEKECFRSSLLWKIVSLQARSSSEFRSPAFQCGNYMWQVEAALFIGNSVSRVILTCLDRSPSSTCSICLDFKILDEKKNILHEVTGKNGTYSHQVRAIEIMSKESLLRSKTCSLTISIELCLEDNTIPVFPHQVAAKIVQDKKETLLDCTFRSLSSDFEELYENRQLSDVTLKLGEEEFRVHKAVLNARSKVFAAMFEHDMKENMQNTVELKQMEVETVKDMLRYIYCGRVRELSSSEALNLYVAADRFDVNKLRSICRELIVMDISINNVCDIAAVADFHKDELLINELKSFLSKNGKDIIKTENWKAVCLTNPVLGTKMFEWAFSE